MLVLLFPQQSFRGLAMVPETNMLVQAELNLNEHLLWVGQPRRGIVLRATDALMIPFSILWGGFAIFWEISAIRSGAPPFFALFGIPFVLVGVYIIFGRFFVDAWQRVNISYAVTNERIIIRSGRLLKRVKSLNLRTLSDVSMEERRDGSGTITFGPTHPMARWYGGTPWPGTASLYSPSFELIPQVTSVYNLIRDAQRQAV
jgi:hypothetical protein